MKLFVAFACIRRLASHRGFTLIETLIAVLILTTAIAGPLTIAAKSFMAAVVVKDQITASYLAQDAVEYIRFVRDTNRLSCGNWLTGVQISGCTPYLSANVKDLTPCLGVNGCYLDSMGTSPVSPTACTAFDCNNSVGTLRYDTTNNRFTYSGSSFTIFKRAIYIKNPPAGGSNLDEASVEIKVYWSDQAGITRSVVVRENLFNWQ